ncbi:hypothetical protein [Thalassovita mediterranea]|uniref:Integral membrane protein n=1 Tax=Thalassovita mediterranea TaxID=340021 RepID=A0A0P1H666_9RHOB|nr:hypothetical protein [Thalassovita mediterranea]MCG7573807.1 hypothetical protein [Phaeobacter sp. CNT1-3]CUH85960.1 hypothetical protein TM5383_03203 [Thalassovita mediterranea]SIS32928.1 hypothetical protein SAMN05421685_107154 [Thalassovita mediterranea]
MIISRLVKVSTPSLMAAALFATMTAVPQTAAAAPSVYPYEGVANHCPAGQQPVSMDGVICCGVPNQSISYQAMMRHGGSKRSYSASKPMSQPVSSGVICPEGQKGCYTN